MAVANKNSHRSRASSFHFTDTPDFQEPGSSSTASPRLQILSGTGSPCGDGSWISLPSKDHSIEDDYSEIEYSDMDGEDDMIYDTPPYYSYEDDHPLRHQQQLHHAKPRPRQKQQGRPLASSRNDFTLSSMSSSTHSLQEQDQVEEALRASLSTLLAAGPRPRFNERRNRPRKIYTVDTRSQRSSPLVPASPTHMYYSATGSPHLLPSNPESILGDLSPHYFHGSITPSSRDYDSASSDSEATRQKKGYHRRILSTGQPTREHYYEIESTTLNSDDSPFSGSTTPLLSPPHFQKTTVPPDPIANKVLQGPSSLLATRFTSWSVKAQSILDHENREYEGHSSSSSSRSTSPHSSPCGSGASTPSWSRRKRYPIPEPHQGFYSRALDQRSLASHVSVSRLGMAGTLCLPHNVGLRTGMLIRGSSPLRPCSPVTPTSPSAFRGMSGGASEMTENEDNCDINDKSQQIGSDDKENKRWYGQDIGLHLWQTTLGAAALLGTGFGSGMVKKVHNKSVQLHPKELGQDNREVNESAA